ncbi:MAG: zinc-finger domain-containing protein, partial [Planctomycetes bacterium]|nr:zinc-finger domain-containing protein [Planctomycetota bacterium]
IGPVAGEGERSCACTTGIGRFYCAPCFLKRWYSRKGFTHGVAFCIISCPISRGIVRPSASQEEEIWHMRRPGNGWALRLFLIREKARPSSSPSARERAIGPARRASFTTTRKRRSTSTTAFAGLIPSAAELSRSPRAATGSSSRKFGSAPATSSSPRPSNVPPL